MNQLSTNALALAMSAGMNLDHAKAQATGDQRAALRARAEAVITYDRVLNHWSHPESAPQPGRQRSGSV